MRQPRLSVCCLVACLAAAPFGCGHGQSPSPPPQVAPLPRVPADVSAKVRRTGLHQFEIDRPLLGLLARPGYLEHRDQLNGQVVFEYYGQRFKLSPEHVGDQWQGVRAYTDLDARIARSQVVARDILTVLGQRPEDHPGATLLDKATHAIDRQLARVKRAQEHSVDPALVSPLLSAAREAIQDLSSLKTWRPPLEGSLPALLGFEELDLIERVNGRFVRSYGEIFDELSKLGTGAAHIEVELERQGEPVLLTYRIVD